MNTVLFRVFNCSVDEMPALLLTHRLNLIDVRNGNGLVFPEFPTNQYADRQLKKIMEILDVARHITFHNAWHTFSSMASDFGIPLEEVSQFVISFLYSQGIPKQICIQLRCGQRCPPWHPVAPALATMVTSSQFHLRLLCASSFVPCRYQQRTLK